MRSTTKNFQNLYSPSHLIHLQRKKQLPIFLLSPSFVLQQHINHQLRTMTSNMDPLVVGRVVGDVIDMFVPCINMSVHYGPKRVSNGCDIKPSIAQQPPNVKISGRPIESYTLVMTDPDAPSPSEPTMREWIHWMLVNIPGGTDASQGYVGPCPPVGISRYVFILFRQEASTVAVDPPSARNSFSTREFADRHRLGLPVAAVYFNAHKEPASRRS